MNRKNTSVVLIIMVVSSFALLSNSGGSPGGRTGSAVDGGKTCATQGGCHSNASKPVLSQNLISTDIPEEGYEAGKSYKITLSASQEGINKWGFESLVQDKNNTAVGEFTSGSDGNIVSGENTRITHKFASGSGNGSRTWVLDWKAPAKGTGDLDVYAAVLAANGNGKTGGDQLIIDTLSIKENPSSAFVSNGDINKISVYPNPCTDFLTVDGLNMSSTTKVEVIGLKGQVVSTLPLLNTIETSALTSGHYMLRITTKNGLITKPFFKK